MSLSRFDQCCFSRVTLLVVPENHGLCVYLSSGFKGQCFNYAIPIAKLTPPSFRHSHDSSLGYFLPIYPLPWDGTRGRRVNA